MKKITVAFSLLTIAMLCACRNSSANKEDRSAPYHLIEKVSWLIGEWQNKSGVEKITEIWKKENDSVYIGRSYGLRNGDTLSSERIRLEEHGGKLFYIPVVKDQNIGEVVKFTLTSSDLNRLVFENPEHDFPQKISYSYITNDSLYAEISGIYKGREGHQEFPMHRVK